MTTGTRENSVKALTKKTNEELKRALTSSKEELFNLRFQAATGQLTNSTRIRQVKRDVARIYTVLRERELGIIAEPEPKVEKKRKK